MRWLLLLASFSQGLWIDVPFLSQDKNGCGPASVWMLLEYWKSGSAPSVDMIRREIFSDEAGGVYARDMEAYLRRRGFRTFAFRGDWVDIEQHIAKGRPLIVCLEQNARGIPFHYVVVAGIDTAQNLVLVNDPARRKLVSIERTDFEQAWKGTENWTLLAVPEVDLASEAFRGEKHSAAKEHLKSALESDPADAYSNEFLATVYFLENNVESALKYWNRAGKPQIESIHIDPPLSLKPVMIDRAFAFSRGNVLKLDSYRTTKARLQATDLYSKIELDLNPSGEEHFDVVLRAAERDRVPVLSWFRGIAYRTIYPEIFNIGDSAVNIRSLVRWAEDRQRIHTAIATPIRGDSKWRFEAAFDVRREKDWPMRRAEALVNLFSTVSGDFSWTSGFAMAHRQFETEHVVAGFSPRSGTSLKYVGSIRRSLFDNPDHRISVTTTLSGEAGKLFGASPARFSKAIAALNARWVPSSSADNYEMTGRLLSGAVAGTAPLDELFILGLDRDSRLWLRATPRRIPTRSFQLINADLLTN
ncbi:MAG: C39 family peptidase, partial [Acidobacteria bacterium]|nr:C39 family peptidase [Acidobacteriota bacterium]